jgi:NADH-quinone oxidoreductase subunit J
MNILLLFFCLFAAALSLVMLFSKTPMTIALSLLGVLLSTAGIYGLLGEHLVATLQLVVYAGAIMVLFIFSIMLLNLHKHEEQDFSWKSFSFLGAALLAAAMLVLIIISIHGFFATPEMMPQLDEFSAVKIDALGGNSKVLSFALFSNYYVAFESISVALLVAVVGAVILAKRKLKS